MAEALKDLPQSNHPDLLVGFNKADDAGVFKIAENLALVQSLDFFPPIVDDPYSFGRIAAANALSDIYAMGGRPVTAMSIVGFPPKLPASILADILRGGSEKIEESGAVVVGGHSIKDNELKYGVSVTGLIDPSKVLSNSNAQIGDKIYLTKKLGTGLITTAIKRNAASDELITLVTEQMVELNKNAAEIMINHNPSSVTDITGYGLMGHAFEMADGSDVTIRLFADKLPLLPNVLEFAEAMMVPGGTYSNKEFLEGKYSISDTISPDFEHLLFDPQTSGGLFISIPESNCVAFEKELKEKDVFAACIGSVEANSEYSIIVE
ncbi:MAG TPA: selenide, water dikinase SelD [candidate division Zixibacteria bacterium]|nr:selenide, water dikinase SelD [candidate division Zixibacteria bacterium]